MNRSQTKRRLFQFRRSYVVLDLRDPISLKAHEYEAKHKTAGVRSNFGECHVTQDPHAR